MASEAAHTPGPWTVDFEAPHFELDHPGQHPCVHGGGKLIASVGNMEPWVDVWEEWRDNAKLIAKAPSLLARNSQLEDLLERCAGFIENYSDVVDGAYGDPSPNAAMSLLSDIREVLPEGK